MYVVAHFSLSPGEFDRQVSRHFATLGLSWRRCIRDSGVHVVAERIAFLFPYGRIFFYYTGQYGNFMYSRMEIKRYELFEIEIISFLLRCKHAKIGKNETILPLS